MYVPESDTAFPPVIGGHPRILILGSMPGRQSLFEQQYYAHPRNAFWPIMRRFLALPAESSYQTCCSSMISAEFALWDVLAQCVRPGSLDQHIDPASIVVNDFADFLCRYPSIERILFNGGKAAELFRRHALVRLDQSAQPQLISLPSTSPANATMRFEEKYSHWAGALKLD